MAPPRGGRHWRVRCRARPRLDQPLCSLFSASWVFPESGNSASALSCLTDSSASPSLIDFLKPRTAEPRSEPIVLSFFAPKISSTTARMMRSSLNPRLPMRRSVRGGDAPQFAFGKCWNDKSTEASFLRKFGQGRDAHHGLPVRRNRLRAQPKRHGTVIHERNLHVRAEFARRDRRMRLAGALEEQAEHRARRFRRLGRAESRPRAFLSVRGEGE